MASPPEADGVRHPRRLPVDAFEARVRALLRGPVRPSMLSLRLTRSDRARALVGRADAQGVLAGVLDRVESTLRPDDRYAVVSVDEIWLLLADASSESIVRLAARSLADAVRGRYEGRYDDGSERAVEVSARIGAALVEGLDGASADAMVEAVVRALTQARGREDRIAVVPATAERRRVARRHVGVRVRRAIEAGGVSLVFQPQVRLADRHCRSFEALVRWAHDDGELPVEPAHLAAVAEDTGLIGELTRLTLTNALRTLGRWRARGLDARMSLNLSPRVLDDGTFPELVAQSCAIWDVPASSLTFELTEGTIARREREAIGLMHALRELGSGLAIDDFGTGYSSFASLRRFPVDELKIDRSFVERVALDELDRRVVRAVVDVAGAFGLRTVAEGVELPAQADALHALGCDVAQGWLWARAMSGEDAADWLAAFNAPRAAEALGSA